MAKKVMKKIFAIFSVVATLFASCTPDNGDNTPVAPTFPELQEITVESGKSYDVTFTTDKAEQSSTIHIAAGDPDFAGDYKDTVTFTLTVKSN